MKAVLSKTEAQAYLKSSTAPKRTNVRFRITKTERNQLEQSAKQEGVNVSEYARRVLFKAIHKS